MSESSQDHLQSEHPKSPPWTCHAEFYILPFYISPSTTSSLPAELLHDPLEASHQPSGPSFSCQQGGFGTIQIVRYKDSPVGPYDEMLIAPGSYSWAREEAGKRVEGRGLRITRIYVSQPDTCYYGRKHWNIPKHLANFTFTTNPDSSTTLTLRPFKSHISSSPPFFTTTFHSTPYLPSFPLSLSAFSPFVSLTITNPPLPSSPSVGVDVEEGAKLICGSDRWCSFTPKIRSWTSSFGWFDMQQAGGHDNETPGEDVPSPESNFWPGWGRWRMGVYMKDAVAVFEEPKTWPHADAREVKRSS